MPYKNFESLKGFLLLYSILAIFIGIGLYLYFKISQRNNINRTIEDIMLMVQNISEDEAKNRYSGFNTDVAVLGEYFPFDLQIEENQEHYSVKNRFGGEIQIYESFADKEERNKYFQFSQDSHIYEKISSGGGAYIILLTELSGRVCRVLAQVDWKNKIPNFLGLEAGYTTPQSQNNGLYNLHYYVLKDNSGEKFLTDDAGKQSYDALTAEDARKACGCMWRSCSLALKFL